MLDTGNALVFWCIVLKPFSGNFLRWKDFGLRFWEELVSDKMERIQVRVCKNFACHWTMSLWLWFQWDTIVRWPALLASSPPYIVHIQCTYKAKTVLKFDFAITFLGYNHAGHSALALWTPPVWAWHVIAFACTLAALSVRLLSGSRVYILPEFPTLRYEPRCSTFAFLAKLRYRITIHVLPPYQTP